MKRTAQAFSLIELLIVIVILGILAVMGISAARSLLERSQAATCMSNLRQLGGIAQNWSADHDGLILPVVQYTTSVGGAGVTWIDLLVNDGYLPKQEWTNRPRSIMRCPSRTNNPQLLGPKLHYGLNMYPGFTNTAAAFSQNQAASRPFSRSMRVQRPSKTFMFGEVQSNYWLNTDGTRAANIYPHNKGQNLVFYDGHAEYFSGELTLKADATDTYPFY